MSAVREIQKKICLIGNFAVGKTSLVRRFVEGRFDDRYLSTIGVKISRKIVTQGDWHLKMLLWDLAGDEAFTVYQHSYLRGAVGALLVCDLTRPETLSSFSNYAQQLRAINPDAAIVCAGNKNDLEDQLEISREEMETVCAAISSPYVLTSAKTGAQVEAAFSLLADLVLPKEG